jgi:hypothetical protein
MDSRRYPNFGDAEYTPRLRRLGWKLLIDPRARVFCQPNNIPARVVRMTFRERFDALFLNLGHIHNLRRRLYSNLDGAPTRLHGATAFVVFFVRLLLRRNAESAWAVSQSETPLRELYADALVKD